MVSWFSGSWTLPTSVPQCSLSLRYRWYVWNGPMGDGHPRVFYSLYFEQVCISAVTSSGCEKRLYGEGRSKGRSHAYLRSPWLPAVVPSPLYKGWLQFLWAARAVLGLSHPCLSACWALILHVCVSRLCFTRYAYEAWICQILPNTSGGGLF